MKRIILCLIVIVMASCSYCKADNSKNSWIDISGLTSVVSSCSYIDFSESYVFKVTKDNNVYTFWVNGTDKQLLQSVIDHGANANIKKSVLDDFIKSAVTVTKRCVVHNLSTNGYSYWESDGHTVYRLREGQVLASLERHVIEEISQCGTSPFYFTDQSVIDRIVSQTVKPTESKQPSAQSYDYTILDFFNALCPGAFSQNEIADWKSVPKDVRTGFVKGLIGNTPNQSDLTHGMEFATDKELNLK